MNNIPLPFRWILLLLLVSNVRAAAQDTSWKMLPALATHPREDCGFVEVCGRFYLIGGRGVLAVEAFDPRKGSWTKLKPTPFEMHHFQAVAFHDEVYVVGGMKGGFPHEQPLDHIWIYNPAKDTWRKGAGIPADRRRGSGGTVVYKNRIYLVGGITDGHYEGTVKWMDVFDPATGRWQKLPDAPHARDHFSAVIIGGKIYVAGGRRTSYKTGQVVELTESAIDVYDIARAKWTTLADSSALPTQRAGCTTVAYQDLLIVIGGESALQERSHAEAEVFDTKRKRWYRLPSLITGRHDTQAIVYKGRIFIAAGSVNRGGGPDQSSVETLQFK